jgi:hypothetical protein
MNAQIRKKRILIVVVFVVILFFSLGPIDGLVSGPIVRVFGDSMDWRSRRLMGLGGADCGRVRINGDPKVATDCALKAQSEGRPFRVRYDIRGYDAEVAGGIVRTPSGELYALSFDGNIHGGGATSLLAQRSTQSPCPKPTHLWVNPKGRINCFQQELSYPKDLMSPNMEPY